MSWLDDIKRKFQAKQAEQVRNAKDLVTRKSETIRILGEALGKVSPVVDCLGADMERELRFAYSKPENIELVLTGKAVYYGEGSIPIEVGNDIEAATYTPAYVWWFRYRDTSIRLALWVDGDGYPCFEGGIYTNDLKKMEKELKKLLDMKIKNDLSVRGIL